MSGPTRMEFPSATRVGQMIGTSAKRRRALTLRPFAHWLEAFWVALEGVRTFDPTPELILKCGPEGAIHVAIEVYQFCSSSAAAAAKARAELRDLAKRLKAVASHTDAVASEVESLTRIELVGVTLREGEAECSSEQMRNLAKKLAEIGEVIAACSSDRDPWRNAPIARLYGYLFAAGISSHTAVLARMLRCGRAAHGLDDTQPTDEAVHETVRRLRRKDVIRFASETQRGIEHALRHVRDRVALPPRENL
jgi:hypothetical protein